VQSLRRLICLCTDCHTVTHFGLATIQGRDAQALRHLRAVAGLSARDADVLVEAAFELWHQRSRLGWALDLGVLTRAGVTLRRPPAASERTETAVREPGMCD
jgi:hypothetical protein